MEHSVLGSPRDLTYSAAMPEIIDSVFKEKEWGGNDVT